MINSHEMLFSGNTSEQWMTDSQYTIILSEKRESMNGKGDQLSELCANVGKSVSTAKKNQK
jgi:hypothetical protein